MTRRKPSDTEHEDEDEHEDQEHDDDQDLGAPLDFGEGNDTTHDAHPGGVEYSQGATRPPDRRRPVATLPSEFFQLSPETPPPECFGPAGRELWESYADRYDFEQGEGTVLVEACHTVDLCRALKAQIDLDGYLLPWGEGQQRSHPLLARLEASRTLLGRLLKLLKQPEPEPESAAWRRRSRSR